MSDATPELAALDAEGGLAADPAPSPAPEPGDAPVPEPSMADRLLELVSYGHVVMSWVGDDGYPFNVDAEIEIEPDHEQIRFSPPDGFHMAPGSIVAFTGSHIRPLPGGGFDERRHLTLWGVATPRPRGRFVTTPEKAWAWDGDALPLPAAYEAGLPKARRYYAGLSRERGVTVRPQLPRGLLLMRATRAPFLSATFVPVILGIAIAARTATLDVLGAVLTLAAAAFVHFGLNVANDVFDTIQGADDANATPTKFSGGSRVIQNALMSVRGMSLLAVACYGIATALGIAILALRGSPALIAIIVLGLFISLAYTMPPFKLVYRGLGEIATFFGFGPVMLLGAYAVQTGGALSLEAFVASIPVGLLVAMILYVNEIPDRAGDAKVGKRTLPVRWTKAGTIRGFDVSAWGSILVTVAGVAAGILPIPALLVVLAAPLVLTIHRGLVRFYDQPFAMMDAMAVNIRLHLVVGLLLLVAYLVVLLERLLFQLAPYLW
jgi:1,4-dihydroxy-2-naphthoate polyprenyltransferase